MRTLSICLFALGLTLGQGVAAAEEAPRQVHLVSRKGACPHSSQVAKVLSEALPAHEVTWGGRKKGVTLVRMREKGSTYRVRVGGKWRAFEDAERRCERRARRVAIEVFEVLAARGEVSGPPPLLDLPPPKPPAAESAGKRKKKGPRAHVEIEIAGVLDMAAPAAGQRALVVGGGTLRLLVGRGRYSAVIGASAAYPADLALETGPASLLRIPIEAGFQVSALRLGSLQLTFEIGALGVVTLVRGEGYENPVPGVAPGVRAGAQLRAWLGKRVALTLGGQAQVTPFFRGIKGCSGPRCQTPMVWAGITLGLTIRARK